jgi:ubiquinone/menaquinone biosynthesis C-methylase UbiE
MGYLHGYSNTEQRRLVEQAHFLEEKIFESFDLTSCRRMLEVGCGTGAECEILLRRNPDLFVTAIDRSAEQLAKARAHLENRPQLAARCEFIQADAMDLSVFASKHFDSAYFCWVLEHVSAPVEILRQTRSVLVPGARVYISEVFNQTLFVDPAIPALKHYWTRYNSLQRELGGDPDVGVRLGRYLQEAGFRATEVWPKFFLFDSRDHAGRARMMNYWADLMLSAVDQLLERRLILADEVQELKSEWAAARDAPATVFYYHFMQAIGSA